MHLLGYLVIPKKQQGNVTFEKVTLKSERNEFIQGVGSAVNMVDEG